MPPESGARFARLALACVTREFPYQPGHVVRDATDVHRPRELHPAFYGCYDWHSAVHGHWLLVHVLRREPGLAAGREIRLVLDAHLAPAPLAAEANYLRTHPHFERPYGWAWLLKLALELRHFDDPDARRWHAALAGVVDVIRKLYLEWLPRQTYPIRTGTHANTAFGVAFALDWAIAAGDRALAAAIRARALDWYGADRDYPAAWEPGGNDFLSPCLVEADLMRRVVEDFPAWLAGFLPAVPPSLAAPAQASDRSDGQLAHLDGLNLSRAACCFNLARAAPARAGEFLALADRHLGAGLAHVASGSYAGEHWLASFAAYAAACALEAATSTPAARSRAT